MDKKVYLHSKNPPVYNPSLLTIIIKFSHMIFRKKSTLVSLFFVLLTCLCYTQNARLVVQEGHSDAISALAFNEEGTLLASGSWDNTVKIWDVKSSIEIKTLKRHIDWINYVQFNENSTLLASCGHDNKVIVWDVLTGTMKQEIDFFATRLYFHRDRLYLIGRDHKTAIFDLNKNELTYERHNLLRQNWRFWPDTTASTCSKIDSIFDSNTPEEVVLAPETSEIGYIKTSTILILDINRCRLKKIIDQENSFLAIALSIDHTLLFSGGVGPEIKVYDWRSKDSLFSLHGHQSDIHCFALSTDGKFLASGSLDNTIKIWDIGERKEIFSLSGQGNFSYSIDLPEADSLARIVVGSDNDIRIWDYQLLKNEKIIEGRKIKGSPDKTTAQSYRVWIGEKPFFFPEKWKKKYIKKDGGFFFQDPYSNIPPKIFIADTCIATYSVKFSQDSKFLAAGNAHGSICVWDLIGQQPPAIFGHHSSQVIALDFFGDWLASTSADGSTSIWSIRENYKEVKMLHHDKKSWNVKFSNDGKFLAVSTIGVIEIYRTDKWEKVKEINLAYQGLSAIAFSKGNNIFGYSQKQGEITFINTDDWEVSYIAHTEQDYLIDMLFLPYSDLVVAASIDRQLNFINYKRDSIDSQIKGFDYSLYSIAYNEKLNVLAVSDFASEIFYFNLGRGSYKLIRKEISKKSRMLDFSPDGRFLASSAEDGFTELWDAYSGTEAAKLILELDNRWSVLSIDSRFDGSRDALSKTVMIREKDGKMVADQEYFYDYYSPKILSQVAGKEHNALIQSVDVNDNYLVSASKDQTIKLWSLQDYSLLHTFRGHFDAVRSAVMSPLGNLMASYSWDNVLKIWDRQTGVEVSNFKDFDDFKGGKITQGSFANSSIRFFPDETKIAAIGAHKLVVLDLKNKQPIDLAIFGCNSNLLDVKSFEINTPGELFFASSPRYSILKPSSVQGTNIEAGISGPDTLSEYYFIYKVDFDAKKTIRLPADSCLESISVMAFNKEESILAYGDYSGMIKMYSFDSQRTISISGHNQPVEDLAFTPDGRFLISVGGDKKIMFWRTDSWKLSATLVFLEKGGFVIFTPGNYYYTNSKKLEAIAFDYNLTGFPPEQFDLKFNRPDIVLSEIGLAPERLIKIYHNAYKKRLQKMHFSEEMLSNDFHVPEINILTQNIPLLTTKTVLRFDIKATDTQYSLDRLNIFINDVPIYGINGIDLRSKNTRQYEQTLNLILSPGENKIQVSALNQAGAESLKETFYVTCTAAPKKSDLYLVCIGVGEFENADMNLTYPTKDVADLVRFFQHHDTTSGRVVVDTILNTSLSPARLKKLQEKLRQTQVDDRVILFVADHGIIDDSLDYYLATYNTDFSRPKAKAIPYETLENLLDSIPARQKLMLMDACHAGEIDKEEVTLIKARHTLKEAVKFRSFGPQPATKHLGLENSFELMKELFVDLRRGTGTTVISSAGGVESAMEGDIWKNSVFMYALLTGLQEKKADLNKDGAVMVSELQTYLGAEVEKLTDGNQRPIFRAENISNDWRVW